MRRLAAVAPLVLYAGCSCQGPEYSFPQPDAFVPAEEPQDLGSWLSMDTAPDGVRLTMAYYDREQGALGYAVGTIQDDGSVDWVHERVDGYKGADGLDRGDRGKYASQKTAPDGTVWIAYQDAEHGGLYAVQRTGGPVWSEPVLVDPGAGAWASLAYDSDGWPVVAHHHPKEKDLRVSRFDGSDWSTEIVFTGSDWTYTHPETGETEMRLANVGQYARLVIHEGVEYISFYDAAQQTLNLLEGKNGDYTHTVVDKAGNVGQWPSMWTDGKILRIAYHDVGNQDLKLATRDAGSWSTEVVDDGEYRGADTEIFMRGDKVAILYFDGFQNDMLLATQDGNGWAIEHVGGDHGAVGFHNEVAYADGIFWLASYDYTSRKLYLASTN